MSTKRRDFMLGAGGAPVATAWMPFRVDDKGESEMYGLISKIATVPSRRDDLIAIFLEAVIDMPGCLSYIVPK